MINVGTARNLGTYLLVHLSHDSGRNKRHSVHNQSRSREHWCVICEFKTSIAHAKITDDAAIRGILLTAPTPPLRLTDISVLYGVNNIVRGSADGISPSVGYHIT